MTRTSRPSPHPSVSIRSLQYRDLDAIDQLMEACGDEMPNSASMVRETGVTVSRWYGLLKFINWFPNPLRHALSIQVAEVGDRICGMIQTSPFNQAGTTWRVDRVHAESSVINSTEPDKTTSTTPTSTISTSATLSSTTLLSATDLGSLLLRNSFTTILQARTWILELGVNDDKALALYRHNGFQPVAQMTYWSIGPEQLQEMSTSEPDLPNLMPVSNADAHLLYQLDNMAMPPLVRQVFDRQPQDFKTSLFGTLVQWITQWVTQTEVVSGYVFESVRKVAIAHFQLKLNRDGTSPHSAQLTVHPAYTWLYPEVMAQMARVTREFPTQSLQIISADYHPEREAYLERVGAERTSHTLLMSRSVWHKLRETRLMPNLDSIPLGDVIPGFQPTRKPVPGRIALDQNLKATSHDSAQNDSFPHDPDPC
jgi:hypothetical protein